MKSGLPNDVEPLNQGMAPPSKHHEAERAHEREQDRLLVERLQSGDRSAFRELYDRYQRRAFSIAFGMVKNESDARDIVQDAFIKAYRNIASFQGTAAFYTWFYRIVFNVAIDHTRKKRPDRGNGYQDELKQDEDGRAAEGAVLPNILEGNPRRTLLRKELSQALDEALNTLPEHHRAVILLREVDGLSYEEMAEILDIPKGTIMSRLFHARKKMQEALAPYMAGNADTLE